MKRTIEMTNMEIVNVIQTLNSPDSLINSNDPEKKLPVSLLWTINGNIKSLKVIFDRIHEEELKINQAYFNDKKSEINEDGVQEIKMEFREEFLKEKNDLFAIKNDVDVTIIPLDSIKDFKLTPSDFNSISFMIDDESVE